MEEQGSLLRPGLNQFGREHQTRARVREQRVEDVLLLRQIQLQPAGEGQSEQHDCTVHHEPAASDGTCGLARGGRSFTVRLD